MKKSCRRITIFTSILVISTILISTQSFINTVFADDEAISHEYDFVAGIHNKMTFHFRYVVCSW